MHGKKPSLRTVEGESAIKSFQVASYSRSKAFSYLAHDNPGRALAHFNVALSLIPEWRTDLKRDFLKSLRGGCKKLEEEGRLQTAIDIREQALTFYPGDEAILCDTATLYFQLGNLSKAAEFYQLSVNKNPNFLPALRALQTIRSVQLERWHFRMLNDTGRNKAYRDAISHTVQGGHQVVLDIGAGSGLLSLYAVCEGAKHVYACEVQSSIFSMAENVIKANSCCDKITLINKISTDLKAPDDIPQRVSLVITEIFDAALFGEQVLQTLIHAWDNLLLPPCPEDLGSFQCMPLSSEDKKKYGLVIPHSATIWIAAVQCIDIARRYRVLPLQCFCRAVQLVDHFNDSIPYGDSVLCKFCEATISSEKIPENIKTFFSDSALVTADLIEPYDAENLEIIPHGFKFLTKPCSVLNVNFNNSEDLKRHMEAGMTEHTLVASDGGSVDAIALWFHLNLDGKNIISTAPFEESGCFRGWCWHQAIFPFPHCMSVKPGENIVFNLSTKNGILNINPNCDKSETIVIEDELNKLNVNCDNLSITLNKPMFSVSKDLVAFLNNRTWIRALDETASYLFKTLCSVSSSHQILDFNPFPFLGFEILKHCNNSGESVWKLFAFAETLADEKYIRYKAEKYGIEEKQLILFSDQKWRDIIHTNKFDIINLTLIDSTGEFCENIIDFMPNLRLMLSPGGVMIPHSVDIEGQIIESEWLQKNSMVTSNQNVLGFKIAEFVNNFAVDFHPDLNVDGLPYMPLSRSVKVIKFCTNLEGKGSLCSEESGETIILTSRSGTSTGFLYWINFHLLPGLTSVSTSSYDSNCRQVAFLSKIPLAEKSKVLLKWKYHFGIFNFKLIKHLD